jgi:hypothetical protein
MDKGFFRLYSFFRIPEETFLIQVKNYFDKVNEFIIRIVKELFNSLVIIVLVLIEGKF